MLAGWVLNDLESRRDLAAVRITRGGYHRTWRALISEECPEAIAASFVKSVRKTAKAIASADWRDQLEKAS